MSLKPNISQRPSTRREGSFTPRGGPVSTNMASSSADAEGTLASVYQRQLAAFNQYQKPQIASLEAQLKGTSIVDAARSSATRLDSRVRGVTNRRIGSATSSLLPSQRANFRNNVKRGVAKGQGSILTMANEAQRAKRVSVRQSLLRVGEQLTNTGVASLTQVAADQVSRDARNKASKRSFLSQSLGIAGTLIGSLGGPVGASVGGAIGTSIGGGL